MKTALFSASAAIALGAVLSGPLSANAASDHREFEGTVVHVSRDNIKVHGIEGGKPQTLSFLINHGSRIDKAVAPNTYVRVIYDQKLLGIRHADSIDPWKSPAMKMKS